MEAGEDSLGDAGAAPEALEVVQAVVAVVAIVAERRSNAGDNLQVDLL